MRRKLYLVNESGSTFYFDFQSQCAIEEIDGLGFEFDITYEDFESKFVETNRTIPQRAITFSLIFFDGYKGFTRWIKYLAKSQQLRLFYEADGKKFCYVNIRSSDKTELKSNALRTKVKIDCLSLWLVNRSVEIQVRNIGGGKIYTYDYPYSYAVSFNGKTTVTNNSARDVPLLIRMIGNCLNPRVIIRQGGKDIQKLRLLTDERDEPIIEVNASRTEQSIIKITPTDTFDYYDKQDFAEKNFLFLPPGESEIFFDPGVREPALCQIEFKEEYVTH